MSIYQKKKHEERERKRKSGSTKGKPGDGEKITKETPGMG